MSPEKQAALEAVQAARAELADATALAVTAHDSAEELSEAISAFRDDTAKRLNPWRVGTTIVVGAFLASILSLVIFVQAASTCGPDDGGYCRVLAPKNAYQESAIQNLMTTQLFGTEYLLSGGTAEAFLAGELARRADLVVVISPDGDGTWTVVSADISDEAAVLTGLDFTSLPAPQEDVFGEDADDNIVLQAAQAALDSGLPQSVTRLATGSDIQFSTRIVPHGPNTVALFTTIVQP